MKIVIEEFGEAIIYMTTGILLGGGLVYVLELMTSF